MENLCANTSLMLGETLTGISKDMDLTSYRVPLGVCAGIAPFNFPAMIPLWMFPTGLVTGNTYVMKVCIRMPDLLSENLIDSPVRETQQPAWHLLNY